MPTDKELLAMGNPLREKEYIEAQTAAPPADEVEPVAWIDPQWLEVFRLNMTYGKGTSPVTTYPQNGWIPLVPAALLAATAKSRDAYKAKCDELGQMWIDEKHALAQAREVLSDLMLWIGERQMETPTPLLLRVRAVIGSGENYQRARDMKAAITLIKSGQLNEAIAMLSW